MPIGMMGEMPPPLEEGEGVVGNILLIAVPFEVIGSIPPIAVPFEVVGMVGMGAAGGMAAEAPELGMMNEPPPLLEGGGVVAAEGVVGCVVGGVDVIRLGSIPPVVVPVEDVEVAGTDVNGLIAAGEVADWLGDDIAADEPSSAVP